MVSEDTNSQKPPMADIVNTVLNALSSLNQPQRTFMVYLFEALKVFQGKANFRNLSRYSTMSEKRFSRWYRRYFPFAQFNQELLYWRGGRQFYQQIRQANRWAGLVLSWGNRHHGAWVGDFSGERSGFAVQHSLRH